MIPHLNYTIRYCKTLRTTIIAAKKKYYDDLILKSNRTKMTLNIVKTITNNNKNTNKIVAMNINNCPNNNPVTITNAFNTDFSSVAENYIKKSSENNHFNHKDPLISKSSLQETSFFLKISQHLTHEINSIIHSLKTKDSYGYDEISSRILKISAPHILSPLTHIFNKILCTGIFPERLKFSEVKPLNFQIIDLSC